MESPSFSRDQPTTFSDILLHNQLLQYKEGTSYDALKNVLNTLILKSVENGAITTLCVALNLAFFISRPDNLIHVAL